MIPYMTETPRSLKTHVVLTLLSNWPKRRFHISYVFFDNLSFSVFLYVGEKQENWPTTLCLFHEFTKQQMSKNLQKFENCNFFLCSALLNIT